MQRDTDYEIVYGIHPSNEVILAKKRKIYTVFTHLNTSSIQNEIISKLPQYTIKRIVSKNELDHIAECQEHQGIILQVEPFQFRKKPFCPIKNSSIVILDRIQNPRNMGAILRSAYCVGIDSVIITEKNSSGFIPSAFKASAGLAEYLSIMITTSLEKSLTDLEKIGYQIYITGFGGVSPYTILPKTPYCIVIGNEGGGVSPLTIKKRRILVTIPQITSRISFNASTAAGIVMSIFQNADKSKKF